MLLHEPVDDGGLSCAAWCRKYDQFASHFFVYFLQRIEHLLLNLFELVLHLHHDILHLCLIRL